MKTFVKYYLYRMRTSFPIMAVLILCGVVVAVTEPCFYLEHEGQFSVTIYPVRTDFLLALATIIIPLIELRTILNRKGIVLTFSLPVSRKSASFAHYLCGLTYLFCFYLSILSVRLIEAIFFNHKFFDKLNVYNNLINVELFPKVILAYLLGGVSVYTIFVLITAAANNMVDAIIYSIAWQALPLLVYFFMLLFLESIGLTITENLDFFTVLNPFLFFLASGFLFRLHNGYNHTPGDYNYYQLIFIVVVAMVCLICYFAVFCKKKAHNIGGVSTGLIGYKVMLPIVFVSVLYLAFMVFKPDSIVVLPFILGAMILSYMIYRRSVKLKLADWLCMAAVLAVAGIMFAISQFNA